MTLDIQRESEMRETDINTVFKDRNISLSMNAPWNNKQFHCYDFNNEQARSPVIFSAQHYKAACHYTTICLYETGTLINRGLLTEIRDLR